MVPLMWGCCRFVCSETDNMVSSGRAAERLFVPGCFVSLKGLGCSIYSTLCDVAPGLSCLPFTRCQVLSWRRQLQGQSRSQPLSCGQAFCECGRGHHAQLTHGQPSLLQGPGHPDRRRLPPVSICAHLQMHRSLSASLVLKSLPGWLMLLILPADPVRPFRWILGAQRGEEGDERVCADVKHFPQSSRLPEAPARTCPSSLDRASSRGTNRNPLIIESSGERVFW